MSLGFLFIVVQNIATVAIGNGHGHLWGSSWSKLDIYDLLIPLLKHARAASFHKRQTKKYEPKALYYWTCLLHTQTPDTGWSTNGSSLENWVFFPFFFGWIELRFIMMLVKFPPNNNSEIFHNFIVELSWWIPVP